MNPESFYRPAHITRAVSIDISDMPLLDPRVTSTLPRINTGFEKEHNIYDGEVVPQKGEPICTVAAFISAVYAAGGQAQSEEEEYFYSQMEDDLYRDATIINKQGQQQGLDFGPLQDIVSAYPELGITVDALDGEDTLMPIALDDVSLPTAYADKVIRHNARVIKYIIDGGDTIMTTVKYPNINESHSVAIVGYAIDDYGFMSVQHVDSNVGLVDMPLEYFSTMLLQLNNPQDPDSLRIHVVNSQIEVVDEY